MLQLFSRLKKRKVGTMGMILLSILLQLLAIQDVHAGQDYRFLPTPVGGGQDVSYYINAACRSRSRLYVGGVFNLVGQETAFNFGYFENGTWTSPPVTIGPDPMTLLYNPNISSSDSQGKILALACPPPLADGSTVVLIGGDFTQGGLRLGGAGGIPFVGPDGPRILHHLAIFRVEPNPKEDSETSNLCPVIHDPSSTESTTTSSSSSSSKAAVEREEEEEASSNRLIKMMEKDGSNPEDQYAKMRCSPGIPKSDTVPPGVHLYQSSIKLTGPPETDPSAYVSAITCLNEKCTNIIVGGSFNMILGTTAYSIARLTFDDNFYAAKSVAIHRVEGWSSTAQDLASPLIPEGSWTCPSRSMGGFLSPIPGVDGAVHSIEVLNDRYVFIAGSFTRAGALNAPNVVMWDQVSNDLVCLGKEGASSDVEECYSPEFCCQGIPGDIRVALTLSSNRILLGGSFADASSPAGVISANLAVLDLEIDANGQQKLKMWTRLRVIDDTSGRDVAPNGPITSALCVEEESNVCRKALVGGWFDGLDSFAWNKATGGLDIFNATPDGLLPYPLAMLTLPSKASSPATLEALSLTTVEPPPFMEKQGQNWTRPSIGVNILIEASLSSSTTTEGEKGDMVTMFGGKLTSMGNVAALLGSPSSSPLGGSTTSLSASDPSSLSYEAIPLIQMSTPGNAGPLCWESQENSLDLSIDNNYPSVPHGASASFCCFVGSLCPYEGVAVNCPQTGGFYCMPNMTKPECCAQGSYCPNPGYVTLCGKGSYCPRGSTSMTPCTWWMWCHKTGLDRPDKIMAGVIALVLIAAIFLIVLSANWMFLRCRAYFRQARDNDRRGKGLMTSRGTHHQQLVEPLLSGRPLNSGRKNGGGGGASSPIKSASRRRQQQGGGGGGGSQQSSFAFPSPLTEEKAMMRRQSGEMMVAPPIPSQRSQQDHHQQHHQQYRQQQQQQQQRCDSSVGSRTASEATSGGGGGGPFPGLVPLLRERHKVDRIDLHFDGLTVELPGSKKKVLNAVTGGFRAGRVTAIMGPSGCGKTTLISALSNRLGLGTRVTGTTYINGTAESATALHDLMGFVPQDDIMYEDLTVKENLTFCCELRADPSMSRKEQQQHVDKVIDSLGLFPSRHSMIGSTEDRGISGGQRKRVNVGMELTSKPLVLFLDEPTSGLDSTTAEELMQYLHRLTATGLTIAAVIHQPRIEVFLGVDDVIFLGRGGKVAYYGTAKDAVQYFTEQGYAFLPNVNPADRILDIITKADDSLYEKWQTNKNKNNNAGLTSPTHGHGNTFGFWNPKLAEVRRITIPADRDALSSAGGRTTAVSPTVIKNDGGLQSSSSSTKPTTRHNRRPSSAGPPGGSSSSGGGAGAGRTTSVDRGDSNAKRGGAGGSHGGGGRTTSVDRGDNNNKRSGASAGGRRPSFTGERNPGDGRRSPMMMVIYEEQLLPSRSYPAFHSQAWTCLRRSLVQQHNNLVVVQHDLYLLMVFGLLVGLFDLGIKQYELSVLCMGLTSTLTGVRFFSAERVVFWRECSSGISIPAYYLGKVLSALPITFLYPLGYLSFYYNMGFPRVSFTFYYLVLLWAGWVCFGVGVIMSLVFEPKNAQIGAVVIALVGFLFGGHNPNVVTLEKTAPGRIGMFLSYVRWSIGALLLQDASLNPQCGARDAVGALAMEGFVSKDVAKNSLPQTFEPRVVDTEVAHCRQMLVNICILYLTLAMVLMWLSGKYRARMIGWDYFKTGLRQWRVRVRERLYLCLQRNHGWLPTWVIDALVGGGGKYESVEEYDDDDEEEEWYESEYEEEEEQGDDDVIVLSPPSPPPPPPHVRMPSERRNGGGGGGGEVDLV